MKQMIRGFVVAVLVSVAAALQLQDRVLAGSAFDARGLAIVEYPTTGAELGQGFNLQSGLSTTAACIEGIQTRGTAAPLAAGQKTPQIVQVSIRNNKDASTYFNELNVSASTQATFFGVGVNGKVGYVTKHTFNQETETLSIYERAEQHRYLLPQGVVPAEQATPGRTIDTNAMRGLQLKKDMVKLARRKPDQFRTTCGDGYVAVIIEGAELIATLSLTNYQASSSRRFDSTATISAFGGNVSSTVQDVLNTTGSGNRFSLDFLRLGPNDLVPIDKAGLLRAIQELSDKATSAPYPFQVVVRRYRDLPNWPADAPPFVPETSLDRVMAMYWRTDAALRQAVSISRPSPYPPGNEGFPVNHPDAPPYYLMGFNGATPLGINNIIGELTAKRTALANQAQACAASSCDKPKVSNIELYSLAAQLPLPLPPRTTNLRAYALQTNDMRMAVDGFNVAKSSAIAGALSRHGRGPNGNNCAGQRQYVREHMASGVPGVVTKLQSVAAWISNAAPLLRDDALDYYVRQPKNARCLASPLDVDCTLKESDITGAIASSVPLNVGVDLRWNDSATFADWGGCPFMTPPTPPMVSAYLQLK